MNLLDYYAVAERPVETCVVGSGGFGRSFLAQGQRAPLMHARVAVDVDAATAAAGFTALGIAPADVVQCRTREEARRVRATAGWRSKPGATWSSFRRKSIALSAPIWRISRVSTAKS